MNWLDSWHRAEPQEMTLEPDYVAKVLKSNVVPFNRKKACIDVNRAAAEELVLMCSDEDLDALCRDLGKEVIKAREAFFTVLDAQAKALNEKSRRAAR